MSTSTRKITTKGKRSESGGCTALFFSFFLLVGLLFSFFFIGSVVSDIMVYVTFTEGQCKITGKELLESDGEDGTTYAPHFRYIVLSGEGQEYRTEGYLRTTVYSSGRRGKEAILDQFVVERTYPCWYNPSSPTEAVLKRGLSMGWGILFIIIPLVFVTVGLWGVTSGIRAIGKSPEAIARRVSVDTGVQLWIQSVVKVPGEYLPIRLVTKTSHIKALGGTIFIALFWNGIVSIFLAIGIFDDNFPFWVWLFLTPFVLIGLYLIYTVGRQLLIWLTADETITEISQEPLQPGQSAELFMIQKGRKKVQTVQVKVTCQEKVTYRQGTDTRTEQATLYETIIYDQFDFTIDGSGWQQSIPFTIPDNAMHSFKFDNNELSWQIEFELKVAKAPDFSLVFPFRVVPPGVTLE